MYCQIIVYIDTSWMYNIVFWLCQCAHTINKIIAHVFTLFHQFNIHNNSGNGSINVEHCIASLENNAQTFITTISYIEKVQ